MLNDVKVDEEEEEEEECENSTPISTEIETTKNVTTTLTSKYKSININIVYLIIVIVKYTLPKINLEDNTLSTILHRNFEFDIKSIKLDIDFIIPLMAEIIETVKNYVIFKNVIHQVLSKEIDKISNDDILKTIRTILLIKNNVQENIEIDNYVNYTVLFEVLSKNILYFEISQIVPDFVRRIPAFSDLSRTLSYHRHTSLPANPAGKSH
jgi:hypothetical protein